MSNPTKLPPALRGLGLPDHLNIEVRDSLEALLDELKRHSPIGFSGTVLFGNAFVQGNRFQFSTALTIRDMLEFTEHDRAQKGANVVEVQKHSNRPVSAGQEKNIRGYLLGTACRGEKFILPGMMFNFGVKVTDTTPSVTVFVLDYGNEGAHTWVAVMVVPDGARFEITDGAHRGNTIETLLKDKRLEASQRDLLLNNAVSCTIVFESSRIDSHQDFADCGKTKPVAPSLMTAYDTRNVINNVATNLTKDHAFLREYVDAAANSVNLSVGSHRIWSLSAIGTMTAHIVDEYTKTNGGVIEDNARPATRDLPAFITALVHHLPQFINLEKHRLALETEREKHGHAQSPSLTPELREMLGGDVALRAMGLFIFARAFLHAVQSKTPFDDMAKKLATIDWHVLTIDRDKIPEALQEAEAKGPTTYGQVVYNNANPIWRPVLVILPNRYKVSASNRDADHCWNLILAKLSEPVAKAA